MLSELPVVSVLIYVPKGHHLDTDAVKRSRETMYAFKNARPDIVEHLAKTLDGERNHDVINQVLGSGVVLVPTPGHAPIPPGSTHAWPARDIAQALVRHRLAADVSLAVTRVKPVPKSALVAPAERPTPRVHLDSMTVEADLTLRGARRITLVDDIVTRGSTALAAASLVSQVNPDADVRLFAVMRTEKPVSFDEFRFEPALQMISYDADVDGAKRR